MDFFEFVMVFEEPEASARADFLSAGEESTVSFDGRSFGLVSFSAVFFPKFLFF